MEKATNRRANYREELLKHMTNMLLEKPTNVVSILFSKGDEEKTEPSSQVIDFTPVGVDRLFAYAELLLFRRSPSLVGFYVPLLLPSGMKKSSILINAKDSLSTCSQQYM